MEKDKEEKVKEPKLSYAYVNKAIKEKRVDVEKITDGYHTFSELYQHRSILFIALCKEIYNNPQYQSGQKSMVWKTICYSDATPIKDGWFIMGIGKEEGEQITYHLSMAYWNKTNFATTIPKAPVFDKHTSYDVLKRLLDLND